MVMKMQLKSSGMHDNPKSSIFKKTLVHFL